MSVSIFGNSEFSTIFLGKTGKRLPPLKQKNINPWKIRRTFPWTTASGHEKTIKVSLKLFLSVKKIKEMCKKWFLIFKGKEKTEDYRSVIIATIDFMLNSPPLPFGDFFGLQRKWEKLYNGINLFHWLIVIWFKHCPCNDSMLFCKKVLLKINYRKIFCVWC